MGRCAESRKKFKDVRIIESKTQKERHIKLNKTAQKALEELLESLDSHSMSDYILNLGKVITAQ